MIIIAKKTYSGLYKNSAIPTIIVNGIVMANKVLALFCNCFNSFILKL